MECMEKELNIFIKGLVERGFWGKVEIKFENGVLVYLKKEETIKLKI